MSEAERQHPRYAAEVEVKFYVGAQVLAGRTRNASRGGLCADLVGQLPVGEDVDIDMHLVFEDASISEGLRVPARVVWCTPFEDGHQVGIAFRPLDAKRAQYLALFLKYLGEEKAQKTPKPDNVDDRFG